MPCCHIQIRSALLCSQLKRETTVHISLMYIMCVHLRAYECVHGVSGSVCVGLNVWECVGAVCYRTNSGFLMQIERFCGMGVSYFTDLQFAVVRRFAAILFRHLSFMTHNFIDQNIFLIRYHIHLTLFIT